MTNRKFFLIIVGLIILTLLYVRSRFLAVELSYQLGEKRMEMRDLEKKKRELNLELSVLQSPARIEDKAKEKFGLRYFNEGSQRKVLMKAKDSK